MKKNKWLTMGLVLAVALVMLCAVPAMAQMRGKGQWGQGGQGWGCGQGPGMGYGQGQGSCPNYQAQGWGNQYCQGNWSTTNPQVNAGRRGFKGSGRSYQPNTQPSAPNVTQ